MVFEKTLRKSAQAFIELIGVIEKKTKIMHDRSTQASSSSSPEKPARVVEVVMPMDLHGSLNEAELKRLGNLQRQLAREFV